MILSNFYTLVLWSDDDSRIRLAVMRGHHRRWAVVFVVLVVATAGSGLPRQSFAQDSADDGHSYIVIASADLDLFPNYGEGRALIGKYRIKGIRIVAVEDVPASACGMYDVTARFQSIEPRAAQ